MREGGVTCTCRDLRGHDEQLAMVEKALALVLQEENPLPPHHHEARQAALSQRLHSAGATSSSPPPPLHAQDLAIISRLLNQVHLLMEDEKGGEFLSKLEGDQKRGLQHVNVAAEKNMVEAVVEIASAAAEAAKAAAASSGKNLEVMETLLAKSEKNTRPEQTNTESHDDEESSRPDVADEGDQGHGAPPFNKDLLKKLERQNAITHWILGLMVVATAIWRFKILSMIMGVRKTFTNPFQTIGDIFSEGLKGSNKEDLNGAKGFQKAHTVLPSLLGGEEREITKKTETSTKEDFKIGEALTLSLDNLLHACKSSGSDKEEDSSME